MSTQYRKNLPGTTLDYFDTEAAVEAIQPGAWATLPYTSRVHAENIVRKADPSIITDCLKQIIDRKRDLDLPNQSDTVGNLMLGWEDDTLSLRLSANYKSQYLYELAGIADKAHDLHVDAQTFVDFSARYSLTKNLQVSFEAQNLTDQPYFVYSGNRRYNNQYE